MKITVGENWHNAQTAASVGVLVMRGVENPSSHSALQSRKVELEQDLRRRFSAMDRSELRAQPTLAAYDRYYRQFKKTYHLQLQLESVLAGKPIPSIAALVEAMFMAELEDQLLTAGHDFDSVQPPLHIDISDGAQTYTCMNNERKTLKRGDLYIADATDVLSSVIYGPDKRTRIRLETTNVLFTTYGVPGIESAKVLSHLETLRDYVHLVSPEAQVIKLDVVGG
jgi:DNA/RNA-binding domain of Phe-tRNA-synthetase-like protein